MSSDESNVSDKVEILSTEDERLKSVGEILSSDSSRKILQLLFNQSFTANQIAQKTDMSLQLVIHHLKKMQSTGIVKITNIGKNTKSHDMKFYTIDKVALVILPSEMSKPAKKSKSLFNSFNRIHRLATLGGVSIAAWFSSQFLQNSSNVQQIEQTESSFISDEQAESPMMMSKSVPETSEKSSFNDDADVTISDMLETESFSSNFDPGYVVPPSAGDLSIDLFWSTIIVLGIIIAGLAIEVGIKSRNLKNDTMAN